MRNINITTASRKMEQRGLGRIVRVLPYDLQNMVARYEVELTDGNTVVMTSAEIKVALR